MKVLRLKLRYDETPVIPSSTKLNQTINLINHRFDHQKTECLIKTVIKLNKSAYDLINISLTDNKIESLHFNTSLII